MGVGTYHSERHILSQFYIMLYIILCPEKKSQQYAIYFWKCMQGCGRRVNLAVLLLVVPGILLFVSLRDRKSRKGTYDRQVSVQAEDFVLDRAV